MSEWYDIPSEEMTLEQAQSAVRELRKKVAEQFSKMQNEWISVKDRLPEKHGWYLVFKHRRFSIAEWTGDCWYNENDLPIDDIVITHWMPLPEPPKENNNET